MGERSEAADVPIARELRPRRGRHAVRTCAAIVIACFAGGVYLLRGSVEEWLCIRRLRSTGEQKVSAALGRLAEMRSCWAAAATAEVYRRREQDWPGDGDDAEAVAEVVRAAARMGSRTLAAVLEACAAEKHAELCVLLRELGEKEVAAIEACLESSRDDIRWTAAWALVPRRSRDPGVRRAVRESLRGPETTWHREALDMLLSMQNDRCKREEVTRPLMPDLAFLLQDPDKDIRFGAAECLAYADDEDAVPALLAALRDPEPGVQRAALEALFSVSRELEECAIPRQAVSHLIQILKEDSGEKAELAALFLGSTGLAAREVFPELLRATASGKPNSIHALLMIVHSLGSQASAAVGVLTDAMLRSDDPFARRLAASGLGELKWSARSSLPSLLGVARNMQELEEVRGAALTALARVDPAGPQVLEAITEILRDASQPAYVRDSAAFALGYLRPQADSAVSILMATLRDGTVPKGIREGAAGALGLLGPLARKAIPCLEELLDRGDDALVAARAIWRIDPRFVDRAVTVLSANAMQRNVEWAFQDLGPLAHAAVPSILARLKEGRCAAAVPALVAIGKPAVPAVIDALRSDDVVVRSQAAEVLGKIGPAAEAAIPALEAALGDEDDEVRREARRALPRVSALRELHRPPGEPPDNPPRLTPLLRDDEGGEIATREGWERRREAIRRKWTDFLGELPAARAPLAAEVLETAELTKVTRRRIRYQIEEGVFIDGYLIVPWDLPLDGSRKAPGVVVFHQTVDTQAQQPAGVDPSRPELHVGIHLAERGFVTLCPRCFIFDEGAGYADHVRKMQERHPTWKGMNRMLFDAVRAADYLEALPYVDSTRLGCIGHSLGAKEALYAAAFDERYRAAVFSEGGIGLGMTNWDAVWYLGPDVKRPDFGLEHHELLALIAPRAFLLLAGGADGADDARASSYIEAALPVFKIHRAGAHFGWWEHGRGHDYPPRARCIAEEFLERALKEPN